MRSPQKRCWSWRRAWRAPYTLVPQCIALISMTLVMGTHCWPSQRNWPSAETCPTAALGLWLKAAIA